MLRNLIVFFTLFGGFSEIFAGTFKSEFINTSDKTVTLKIMSAYEHSDEGPGPYNDVIQEIRSGETVVYELEDDTIWRILLALDMEAFNSRGPLRFLTGICGAGAALCAGLGALPIAAGLGTLSAYFDAKGREHTYVAYVIERDDDGRHWKQRCVRKACGELDQHTEENPSPYRGLDSNGDIIWGSVWTDHQRHRVTIRPYAGGTGIKVFVDSLISESQIPGCKRVTRR